MNSLIIVLATAGAALGIGLHYAIGYLISKVGPFLAFLVLGLILFGSIKILVGICESRNCTYPKTIVR